MLTVVIIMVFGMLTGYLLRYREKLIKALNRTTLIIICVLLFFMGVAVGNNPAIMSNLSQIGWLGFGLALSGTLGSMLLVWFLFTFIPKKYRK